MTQTDATARKECPACTSGRMEELNRIEHDDNAVTIYWRCPSCSHVQITSSRATVQQSGRGK